MAKLLMLDDDEEALTWMRAALESRDHEVTAYTSARAALEALETATPDLIVADILMPEIDGLAFARLARKRGTVPLVFVSVATRQAEAVLAGAIGFVKKPASANDVRAAVERVLGEGARQNTVLVVDDDPDIRDLYRDFLEGRFALLEAANGEEALAILKTRRVDLAIVDVIMPVMNGVDLVRAIRADPSLESLPILVQTSDPSAVRAPVWGPLRVSHVMDKLAFGRWFEEQIHDLPRRPMPPQPGGSQ
jgi:CheY-like chemotaxis protein